MAIIRGHGTHWFAALFAGAMLLATAYELWSMSQVHRFNGLLRQGAYTEVSRATPYGEFAFAYGLQQEGKFAEALRSYSEAGTREPGLARGVMFNTGNLYLRRGVTLLEEDTRDLAIPLIELAKENYRQLLRINSDDWHAKYNLEHALHLLPETAEQEIDEDIMPERSPRALTAAPSRGELP